MDTVSGMDNTQIPHNINSSRVSLNYDNSSRVAHTSSRVSHNSSRVSHNTINSRRVSHSINSSRIIGMMVVATLLMEHLKAP